jgi:hypothetical protein
LQTESPFKHAASTHRGSTTLSFFCPCYALCLGHFKFKTLLTSSSAFSKRPKLLYQTIQLVVLAKLAQASFLGDQENFLFCESSSRHSNSWVPTSSAKGFFQETPARYRNLASCQNEYLPQVSGRIEGAECKKGQLSHQPPIPYVPVVDIVMPKEEPQVFKIKLHDASHLSIPIYSRRNNEEYLAHIVAVLQVIKQKGLLEKCQVLAKAVVRWSEALKNLQEAAESQDTVSTTVGVTACKVEI